MALLCRMSTIQYSSVSVRSYIIYCLSPFRLVAFLTFAILVCRRFDHTPTLSGHAHLDRKRYGMACRVTREWALDVADNFGSVSCTERIGQRND